MAPPTVGTGKGGESFQDRKLAADMRNKVLKDIHAVLKSRRLGFTTDEAIDSTDDVLFSRNVDALLIAHNLDAGKKIFDDRLN